MTLLNLKDWKVSVKVIGISVLTIFFAFLGVLLYILPLMQNKLIDEKRTAQTSIVEVAYSLVGEYDARAQKGEFSVEEAQKRALMRIKNLRYKENDYIWVNDMQPRMLMHPMMPELDGTDLSDYKDPNGKKLFIEMVNVCKKKGGGFVDYQWPKPGETKPVPKISFVKLYMPWEWVIGSGIYIDDVERSVAHARTEMVLGTLIFAALTLSIAYIIGTGITNPLKKVIGGLQKIASGGDIDLTQRLAIVSNDEIGLLSNEFNKLMESISSVTTFKKIIEEEDTLHGVYWRLGQLFTEELGLPCIIYEITDKQMKPVYPPELSEKELLCNTDILIRRELCKAGKTGHQVTSLTYPHICKQFVAESGKEHCCFPIVVGGSSVAVVQLIVERPPKNAEAAGETMKMIIKAGQYIRESLPVIEAKRLTDDLRESTLTDPLTGLRNRRFLHDCIENQLAGVLRRGSTIGLIMCDLDYFKQVNDSWGHNIGDLMLRDTANLLINNVRKSDLVIRFGGEEFLILLIDAEAGHPMLNAERIRKSVAEFKYKTPDGITNKTISLGVSEFPVDTENFWQAIKFADVALYKAKAAGKNTTVRFSADMWKDEQF